MKWKEKIVNSLKEIKDSGRRFPISLGFSIFFVLLRIYMSEMDASISSILLDKLNRVSMVLALGVPLSLNIGLVIERFFNGDRLKASIFYGLELLFLFFYYYFLLDKINNLALIRYAGIWIFLIIGFFYMARLGIKEGYEKYVIHIFSQIFLTQLYSLVLLLGIFFILFTIDQLFDINVKGKYYYYVFLIVSQVFALAFILSKLPKPLEDFSERSYSKSLRILLSYIVIPLISIYTLILYIYFGKILVQWDWPKGLVSHLVLWYSAISVGVIFLITPVLEEDKISKNFKVLFPKLILPILLMMFFSIGLRINEYGITENRYYVVALGIWVTAMMLYISIMGTKRNIVIPISLSLIILNSVFGPLSSFAVSKYSQNKRLENILQRENMILNKQIITSPDIDSGSKKEISNILSYFEDNHSLEDVKFLEKGFTIDDMDRVFGFKHTPSNNYDYDEYFYFGRDVDFEILDLEGFDYMVSLENSWDEVKTSLEDIEIKQEKDGVLNIQKKGETIFRKDLKYIIEDIYSEFGDSKIGKDIRTTEEMTYILDENNVNMKLVFNRISGKIDKDSKALEIDGFSYILFLKIK